MALRPTTSKARAWLVSRAEVATATAPATRWGSRVAQVSTMWPPNDPPITARSRAMPK